MRPTHMKKQIGIIGCGHIGKAILTGLLHGKSVLVHECIVSNPDSTPLQRLFPSVECTRDNKKAAQSRFCIIAVRPNVVETVIKEVAKEIDSSTIVVSVAACVTMKLLEKYFGKRVRLIRIMPNLGVAYGQGVIGWFANKFVTDIDRKRFQKLFSPLGVLVECKNDNGIDKVGMISGSGPGYVAYFMNALAKQAESYRFSKNTSRQMVLNTFEGSITRLKKENITSQDLLTGVATKGGITEEVLKTWEENKFPQIISAGMKNGYAKIKRITKELK